MCCVFVVHHCERAPRITTTCVVASWILCAFVCLYIYFVMVDFLFSLVVRTFSYICIWRKSLRGTCICVVKFLFTQHKTRGWRFQCMIIYEGLILSWQFYAIFELKINKVFIVFPKALCEPHILHADALKLKNIYSSYVI